jgi:diguanylate cyclase (GGDEF)-like protein/PAS domain S-box-containing protein
MKKAHEVLRSISEALDSLGIATCIFDDEHRAIFWNRSFLQMFPEHAQAIYVGEPYAANLRRFYEGRLSSSEMPAIERYIDEGIARHNAQERPFHFEHRGRKLWVASVVLAGIGRIRIWRVEENNLFGSRPRGALDVPSAPIDSNALFDRVADGVAVSNQDGHIIWVNQPFVLIYRLASREAANGLTLEQAYRSAWQGMEQVALERFELGLMRLSESSVFSGAPVELPLPNDRCTLVTGQSSHDGNSYAIHVDITAQKRQQKQLAEAQEKVRQSEALLKATLEQMDHGIMMVNADRVVEVCNRRAVELLGLPPELMASRPTFEQVLEFQWANDEFVYTAEHLKKFVRAGGILDQPQRYDRKRPDGTVIEVHSIPIEGGGVLRTYTDITERKQHEERIRHIARHDGLTSLVTREVFIESLEDAVQHAKRGELTHFAVHYLDLDRFKPINDQYGHLVGDQALTVLAERMRQFARQKDLVARLGGDEFAILQFDTTEPEQAVGLARRVVEGIARPIEIASHRIQVGASIGIAIYPWGGADADTLLHHADVAMYRAKAASGDSISVFEDDLRLS